MRKLLLVVTAVVAIVSAGSPNAGRLWALAQSPASDNPSFEVASVKQNKSGDGFMRIGGPPGRFTATNVPLRQLITFAYQIQPFQLEGGPGWMSADRFDIVAKTDAGFEPPMPGVPGPIQLMMRTLLADRFKLVVHHETKEQPIYALVLARADGRLGSQLKKSDTDCAALFAAARGRGGPPQGPPPTTASGRPQCGVMMRPGGLSAGGFPLSQLIGGLSGMLQRVVADRTGLTGNYDLDLTWTPDQMPQQQGPRPPGAPDLPPIDPNGPSLFTAVQEQLGLKLEATKGPVDVLVIDRAERPTDD